jgi:hypothetical protein
MNGIVDANDIAVAARHIGDEAAALFALQALEESVDAIQGMKDEG